MEVCAQRRLWFAFGSFETRKRVPRKLGALLRVLSEVGSEAEAPSALLRDFSLTGLTWGTKKGTGWGGGGVPSKLRVFLGA